MRTTLSLEDDVAALLARVRKLRKETFKAIVNEALRQGLRQMAGGKPRRRIQFQTQPLSIGRCLVSNLDDIALVLEEAEGERFK